ncbi:Chitobiosyldiphosphodolichol beta-mannosyltransferase [Golovinomyces cichoracearum]|uniref:Chitobiosyldiphosphodolichol beta-mannosyltransferase n=1 Tax=Golovinomyces cichoracearum TaxID=62708 RepID=A0A420J2J4_9PEZI|nr:Chitobiosyldiphosphodolichol beta-mannosyltransferase [Golovinomyces cichoracearum]
MYYLLLTATIVTCTSLAFLLFALPTRSNPSSRKKPSQNDSIHGDVVSIQIIVLGDIGRSPRMQYHALSISKHGGQVEIIGYEESSLHPGLVNNPLVKIIPLPQPPRCFRSGVSSFIITAPLKVLWQSWTLFYALGYRTKPSNWFIVQNPPSIPTLFIALIICFLRQTKLIIDWHNLGWTILAGTRGKDHLFVKIYKYYEAVLGSWASTVNFTVTDAMRRELQSPPYNISSQIITLYDRPAAIFKPITLMEERMRFLEQLSETSKHAYDISTGNTKLIVSSTSWTCDEDFNILLEALSLYASSSESLPSILAIITGKGPEREYYLGRIESLKSSNKLRNITIHLAWLSLENYAKLLACADLGVCLHKSSSGLDLPMKVVDMFGTGLPVIGYKSYESWKELVVEGVNGRGFVKSDELCNILQELFLDRSGKQLLELKNGCLKEGNKRWDEEWDRVVGREILGIC